MNSRLARVTAGVMIACIATACTSGKSPRPDVKALSIQAAASVQSAAKELGREPFEAGHHPSEVSMDRFLDVIGQTATLFGGPIVGEQATYRKKVTPAVVADMELTIVQFLKLLPGGVQFPDDKAQQAVESLDARSEERRFGRRQRTDLETEFTDMFRVLAVLALFSDENLARQVIPPESEWNSALSDQGFLASNGQIMVPAPPVLKGIVNTGWNRFTDTLEPVRAVDRVLYRAIERGWRL